MINLTIEEGVVQLLPEVIKVVLVANPTLLEKWN